MEGRPTKKFQLHQYPLLESPFKWKAGPPVLLQIECSSCWNPLSNGRQAHILVLFGLKQTSWNPLSNRRRSQGSLTPKKKQLKSCQQMEGRPTLTKTFYAQKRVGIPFQTEGEAKVR
jgi:hypothetical protein